MKTLYIYRNVMSFETDNIDDYLFEEYAAQYKNIDRVDEKVASAWEDEVERVENCTLETLLEYINDCYKMLEYKWNWKGEQK